VRQFNFAKPNHKAADNLRFVWVSTKSRVNSNMVWHHG